jgi:hypothetical protein
MPTQTDRHQQLNNTVTIRTTTGYYKYVKYQQFQHVDHCAINQTNFGSMQKRGNDSTESWT